MAIYNLLKYKMESNKNLHFIIDTNIWLYLYSDLHEDKVREISAYSNLLDEIIEKDYEILIPSCIISEFTNVLLRADYNSIKDGESEDFSFKKHYVGSDSYLSKIKEINDLIDLILEIENVKKISDKFSNTNISNLQQRFEKIDWNDSFIVELAKETNSIIVTHDKDFEKIHDNTFNIIRLN